MKASGPCKILVVDDGHWPCPACAGSLDLYGKAADFETMGLPDGGQVGHLLHVTVADVDTGEVCLPDNFGITVFLEFCGLKRQGTVPAPGIDAHDPHAFFGEKKGAFTVHAGTFEQVGFRAPRLVGTGLNEHDIQGLQLIFDSVEFLFHIFSRDALAVGFVGDQGKGTPEYCDVLGRVDIITGTLGKALGGASGGYTSGRREIVGWLRQRSRPYLFSNTVAPSIVSASVKVLDILKESNELRAKLSENTQYFRREMTGLGFDILPGTHPIVPVMLGDAMLAQKMAARMLEKGVYVVGFFYPVVPKGKARIRTQISAAHSRKDLDYAIRMFKEVKDELGI